MSVALHAILAGVAVWRWPRADFAPPGPPKPAPQAADEQPVEVELWSPPEQAVAVGPVGERVAVRDTGHSRAIARSSVTTSAVASTEVPAVPAPSTGAPRSLAMRVAADLQIHELAAPGIDVPVATPPPETPVAPLSQPAAPDSGVPDPRQTHEAFSLHADADGTAHLHDTRNLRWVLGVPTKAVIRNRIAEWQDELAHADETRDYCANPERPIEHPIGSIGATVMKFDVSDWMMRRHGQDPYASAKLAQLDATRDDRALRGAVNRHAELGRAGELMQHNLETVWATQPDPAERRRELFALWDECSETGTSDVVEAGARARARVVAFVREHLPPGSHEAFTTDELAALNRDKQSHASFAPYADGIE